MEHVVYKIINTVNDRKYIGIHSGRAGDILTTYFGSGKLLKQAYSKYGVDKFICEILYVFETREQALEKEKELVTTNIIESREYYNITKGGGAPPTWLGKKHKVETIKKCSASKIGAKNAMHGKPSPRKGKVGPNSRSSKVIQSTLGGDYIKTWNSISEAATALSISRSHISKACRGKLKWFGGYKWCYEVSKKV